MPSAALSSTTPIAPKAETALAADRFLHALIARQTGGLSPVALGQALSDWMIHFLAAPAHEAQVGLDAWKQSTRLALQALRLEDSDEAGAIAPLAGDRRFDAPGWKDPPFSILMQSFLLYQQWLHRSTTRVRGVSPHHRDVVTFLGRQWLDMVCPANFPWLNPEVMAETARTGGMNFLAGGWNWWRDALRQAGALRPAAEEHFRPGHEVAVTPGEVVYRNRLIELIQYAPATRDVRAEPVLIVPSWIMKYYILDLSPRNSMVRYLVERGHTVFILSWHNPGAEDRDLGMEDYLDLGPLAALDEVAKIVPETRIHAVGYCLGGTLLAMAAATLARDQDDRLATLSLLAAETDFTEPGELGLFIDESQVSYLEDIMWSQGFLDGRQMAATFQLLRSRDLIWSRMVREYQMGRADVPSDLQSWNEDVTRLPFRMHSEYLRSCYLDNALAHGSYLVHGRPIALSDIRVPMYVVATEADHVSPWRSVFKIHLLTDADLTFVLTSGGHNVGIVNPPSQNIGHYDLRSRAPGEAYLDPVAWRAAARRIDGSWWPGFSDWLRHHSSGTVAARKPGPASGKSGLGPAPGRYVLEV